MVVKPRWYYLLDKNNREILKNNNLQFLENVRREYNIANNQFVELINGEVIFSEKLTRSLLKHKDLSSIKKSLTNLLFLKLYIQLVLGRKEIFDILNIKSEDLFEIEPTNGVKQKLHKKVGKFINKLFKKYHSLDKVLECIKEKKFFKEKKIFIPHQLFMLFNIFILFTFATVAIIYNRYKMQQSEEKLIDIFTSINSKFNELISSINEYKNFLTANIDVLGKEEFLRDSKIFEKRSKDILKNILKTANKIKNKDINLEIKNCISIAKQNIQFLENFKDVLIKDEVDKTIKFFEKIEENTIILKFEIEKFNEKIKTLLGDNL